MVNTLTHIAPNNRDLLLTELSSISYSLYNWMRRIHPKSLITILAFIVTSPIVLLLFLIVLFLLGAAHIALIYLNFRLKRMLHNEISINYSNYAELKDSKNVLGKMLEMLDKLNKHPDNDLFFIRPFITQVKKTYSHLFFFSTKVDNAIKE